EAVIAADVVDDGLVEAVAADAGGGGVDDAVEGDHGHLGGAAADVQHHGALGFVHRQAGAGGRGHGFLDQVPLARAGAGGRLTDGAAFDLGRAVGHAHQHARGGTEVAVAVRLLDEVLQHLFGDGEVGDHAVLHGPD